MSVHDEVQQQLWELVYDLLSPAEAKDLISRIKSDPELARAYAEVVLKAESLATAARLVAPPESWRSADASAPSSPLASVTPTPSTPLPVGSPFRRRRRALPAWIVGVAASLTLMLLGYSWLSTWEEVAQAPAPAATPVITGVIGPDRVEPGIANSFTVVTNRWGGGPQRSAVDLAFYDNRQRRVFAESVVTNEAGIAQVFLPGRNANNISYFEARNRTSPESPALQVPLQEKPVEYVAQVSPDRISYRPGDLVFYRAVIVRRLNFQADREFRVRFEVRDPQQQTAAKSVLDGTTDHGVAAGSWQIPPDAPTGKYKLAISGQDVAFPPAEREFFVWKQAPAPLQTELELARDSYSPGDQIVAHFGVRAGDQPLQGARFRYELAQGGEIINRGEGVTNSLGNSLIRVPLSPEARFVDATLNATLEHKGQRGAAQAEVALAPRAIEVQFFPEGGRLVAGLPTRVYFRATTPDQQPVSVSGRVLDETDQEVAPFATVHEGRGFFLLQPRENAAYRLVFDEPADRAILAEFPPIHADQDVNLTVPNVVHGPGDPVFARLYSKRAEKLVTVRVACRGALVGANSAIVKPRPEGQIVKIDLAEEASGVLRITAFDAERSPLQPLAERLIYRYPSRTWSVAVESRSEEFVVGKHSSLALQVKNERGEGAQAALGIAVAPASDQQFGRRRLSRLETDLLLKGDLADPQELEDADFYLSDEPNAAQWLDLLLATEGWRRIDAAPADRPLATDSTDTSLEEGLELLTPIVASELPQIVDNREQIAEQLATDPARFYRVRLPQLPRWVLPLSGVCLMGLVLILALAEQVSVRRVVFPAGGIALLAILVGVWAMRGASPVFSRTTATTAVENGSNANLFQQSGEAGNAQRSTAPGLAPALEQDSGEVAAGHLANSPDAAIAVPEWSDGRSVPEKLAARDALEASDSPSFLDGSRGLPRRSTDAVAPPTRATSSDFAMPAPGRVAGKAGAAATESPTPPAPTTTAPSPPAPMMSAPAPRTAPIAPMAPERALAEASASERNEPVADPAPVAPVETSRGLREEMAKSKTLAESVPPAPRGADKVASGAPAPPSPLAPPPPSAAPPKFAGGGASSPVRNDPVSGGVDAFRAPTARAAASTKPEFEGGLRSRVSRENAELPTEWFLNPQLEARKNRSDTIAEAPEGASSWDLARRIREPQSRVGVPSEVRWMRRYTPRGKVTDVRTPQTCYWQPLLITDHEGRATIQFSLADTNAYQLRVDAHGDGRIGGIRLPLVGTQLLAVKAALPESMAVGDMANLDVFVEQHTDSEQSLSVSAETGEALAVEGEEVHELQVAARGRAQTQFRVLARRAQSSEPQRIVARNDTLEDSVAPLVTVVPAGYSDAQSFHGTVGESVTFNVSLPESLIPDSVEVDAQLFPTRVAEMYAMVADVDRRKVSEWDPETAQLVANSVDRGLDEAGVADPELARINRRLLGKSESRVAVERNLLAQRLTSVKPADGTPVPKDLADEKGEANSLIPFFARIGESSLSFLWDRQQSRANVPMLGGASGRDDQFFLRLGDSELGRRSFASDAPRPVELKGTGVWVAGDNQITLGTSGNAEYPYVVHIRYRTHEAPQTPGDLELIVNWPKDKVRLGDLVPVQFEVKPNRSEPLAHLQVVLGLPAGVDVPLDQLEQLRRDGRLAAFDLRDHELWLAWPSGKGTGDTASIREALNFVAVYSGEYTAPPARAYLRGDTRKPRAWSKPFKLTIESD